MKKFSIITVCKDEAAGIEDTILSVVNQTFKDYEYIVIDGGSTDGTLEILSGYKDRIDTIINDITGGVYRAMNRGISLATGEYLIFMNGGDAFANDNVLTRVETDSANEDIIYGNAQVFFNERWSFIKKCPSVINTVFLLTDTIPHQSAFIRKDLFALIGEYNENMKIAADYEFFLEAIIKSKATLKHLSYIISKVQFHGLNSSPVGKILREAEKKNAQNRIVPNASSPKEQIKRLLYSFFIKYPRFILGLRYKHR